MPSVFDYKKEYKNLYAPKIQPSIVDVPVMHFISVEGKGNPNTCEAYAHAIELLYGLSYSIRMSKKQGREPQGYFDYVVPPLESLWWVEGNESACMTAFDKDVWSWTAMIRQAEFVTDEVFEAAKQALSKKKAQLDVSLARFGMFTEGLCVQIMHIGSYEGESVSIEILEKFTEANGHVRALSPSRKHHEIYLNDPRKIPQEKRKTIIRHPIAKL